MSYVTTTRRTGVTEVPWYLSRGLSEQECLRHAEAAGGVVLRGIQGGIVGQKLRKSGYQGNLWLDPATYESPSTGQFSLWDEWHQRQQELSVVEPISPGTYVDASNRASLQQAFAAESSWVTKFGGRLSLALHESWLTTGLDDLIQEMREIEQPYALAFIARYDPLARVGAVEGLNTIIQSVPDVAKLRGDISAIGAVSRGAALGAFGTSSGVRHVFPPDQKGRGLNTGPSVFVPELMDFKLGTFLDQLPSAASPRCHFACCNGDKLRRFNSKARTDEAREHNRVSIGEIAATVLAAPVHARAAVFKQLCLNAQTSAARLSYLAKRDIPVRPQVKAWAELT